MNNSINFNTANLIIVCYPDDAGGKFLINCLGLSDDAVFLSNTMAAKQLNLTFSQSDKIGYLNTAIGKITNTWNDLGLGEKEFFGVGNTEYYLRPQLVKQAPFDPVISKLSHSDKKFFTVAHGEWELGPILNVWPNAKVIIFKNCKQFMNYRTKSNLQRLWDALKGADWPDVAPLSASEFATLPQFIKSELALAGDIGTIIHKMAYDELVLNDYYNAMEKYVDHAIYWDTNHYFSEDETIGEIKKLYELYNLNNFNVELIKQYYRLWISKLVELTQK
jgi:hypothetical protein